MVTKLRVGTVTASARENSWRVDSSGISFGSLTHLLDQERTALMILDRLGEGCEIAIVLAQHFAVFRTMVLLS